MTPDFFCEWMARLLDGWRVLVSVSGDDWRIYLSGRSCGHPTSIVPPPMIFHIPDAGKLSSLQLNNQMRKITEAVTARPVEMAKS